MSTVEWGLVPISPSVDLSYSEFEMLLRAFYTPERLAVVSNAGNVSIVDGQTVSDDVLDGMFVTLPENSSIVFHRDDDDLILRHGEIAWTVDRVRVRCKQHASPYTGSLVVTDVDGDHLIDYPTAGQTGEAAFQTADDSQHRYDFGHFIERACTDPNLADHLFRKTEVGVDTWSELYVAADLFEQVLADHSGLVVAKRLTALVLPVLLAIRSGEMTTKMDAALYPDLVHLANETDYFKQVELVEAHHEFRTRVTDASTTSPMTNLLIERIREYRKSDAAL